ncbi:MAG: hypothetical protein ACXWBP_09295, partial [Limisphaerales bacterium]
MNAQQPENKTVTLLFNPSVYVAGAQALILGIIAILLTSLIGSFGNAHFDGVLDSHVGAAAPLWLYFAEGLIDWLCLTIVLWICGKIISKTMFRAVDIIGTQALARWPALFISLLALPPAFQQFSTELLAQLQKGDFNVNVRHLTVFLMLVVAMVPFVVWMVRLMYKSFSVVCNVRGGKAIGTFVIGLLIAEALSKACIIPLALTAITKPSQLSEKSVAATSDNFTKAGSDFVTLLQEQKFAQATTQFDPAMIKALPEPKLRNVWQDLTKEGGAFQKQLGASVQS